MKNLLKSKKGDMMVEASVVLPIVILIAVLMLRLFAFYLEVLKLQVESHIEASDAWSSYDGAIVRSYRDHRDVYLISGGILKSDVKKHIYTHAYLLNEDVLIRAGELVEDE